MSHSPCRHADRIDLAGSEIFDWQTMKHNSRMNYERCGTQFPWILLQVKPVPHLIVALRLCEI